MLERSSLERELGRLREQRDPNQSQLGNGSASGKVSLVFVSEGGKVGKIPEQLSGGNFVKVPRKQYRSLGAILVEKQANVLLVTGHHWVNHGGRLGEIGAGGPGDSDNLYFHRVAQTGPFPNVELLLMTGCYTLQTDRSIEFFNKIFPNAVIVGYEGSATLYDGWTFLSEFRDLFLVGDPSSSVAEKSAVVAKGIGPQIRQSFATPPSDTYRRVNMPRLKRALRRRPAIFVPAKERKGGTLHRFFWDSNALTTSERAVGF
jgi:hypothetical protein